MTRVSASGCLFQRSSTRQSSSRRRARGLCAVGVASVALETNQSGNHAAADYRLDVQTDCAERGSWQPLRLPKALISKAVLSVQSPRTPSLLTVNPARWYSLLRTADQPCQSTTLSHKAFLQPAADGCIFAPSQPVHGCFAWDVALPRNPSARSRASGRG